MMRALWTASSGMKAMQFSVDTIANNLSNVSTTAYKKEKPEFESLFYATLDKAYSSANSGKPVNLQVGHGVATRATVRDFTMGNLEETGNKLDNAIEGEGFYAIRMEDGNAYYTRDGSFKLAVTEDGNMLSNSNGYPILDRDGNNIYFDQPLAQTDIQSTGEISYRDENGLNLPTGQYIGLFKFQNTQGLEAIGGNIYSTNSASGAAIADTETGKPSVLRGSYLESSNVQVVEEMVRLITAQRAYEMNSKAITTSDEMLQTANQLRR